MEVADCTVLVNRNDKACSCRLHDHVVMIAVANNINLTLPKIMQHRSASLLANIPSV